MNPKIKVNLIAGSGSSQGPGSWIFSDMVDILNMGIDASKFELTITPNIDESQLYDVYHYFHSTLAVQNNGKMSHRALVTIHAMSDLEPNWSFEYKEPYLQKARKVSSVSTSIIDILNNRGIKGAYYTPAGVDMERFIPTYWHEREELSKKFNLKSDVSRFGIISRRYDDGRKGEEFLTGIIQHYNDPDQYRFMFLGSNWGEYLNNIVHEYDLSPELFEVFERGKDCQYEDYPYLYGLMDMVLVTSKVDSGPICILESLAKGIPVISTPTGLANELLFKRIEYEPIGKIVPYGDVFSFIDAIDSFIDVSSPEYKEKIRKILTTPNEYEPINRYSNGKYQDYSWDSFCRRFEDIYLEIYNECSSKMFLEDFMSDDTQKQMISFYSIQATNNLTNIYLENYEQVKHYAKSNPGVVNFKNILKDRPTVIVGAGPSLDKDIKMLQNYQGKVNIFACDAALPILNQNYIKPDVVIVADPSDRQIQNFTGCNGREFITIMPTVVHPMTFNEARKQNCVIIWYNIADSNIELCKWIPKEVGYKGLVRPGVLTSSMVYQIAVYMGCEPITFIGHDLSWSDVNKGYASGISDSKIMYQKKKKMFNQPVFLFNDLNGNIVITELSFVNFIQWINAFLKEYKLEVFNSTGSGILYGECITQIDFEEWCEKYQKISEIPTFPLLYQVYREIKNGNDFAIIPDLKEGG